MNTEVLFRKVAGTCGWKNHQPTIRFHVRTLTVTRLKLGFIVAASGLLWTSLAIAQDASWQDEHPSRRTRAVAHRYPDDELPNRSLAMNDDTPPLTPPVAPGAVDSPSNQPAVRKKAKLAGESAREGEPQAAPEKSSSPRRPVIVDRDNAPEPMDEYSNAGEDGDGCNFGCMGPKLREVLSNRLWFRGEALLWWTRGGSTPPLLTTSPASTPQPQAGVLGQPNTTVLFGDEELNTGLHPGGRTSFGVWLDRCGDSGLEFSYLILGANTQTYSNNSMGNPILARPFYDVSPGTSAGTTNGPSSQLLAYPNVYSGTFNATSTENFQGAEALWRRAIVHGCDGRIDFLAGYRFLNLTDGLVIESSVTTSGTGGVAPAGTTISVSDTFHTHNNFNGGELGFATQWHRNRWSFDTLLKLGIGETNTQVYINGGTTVIANGTTATYNGGLLALPSNMGSRDTHQFSAVPEIGFTLGYDLTPRLKATAGYTLLYWANVARPGDQIDLNVDSRQFPPPLATGTRPEFVLHTSDFWAQGVNLGLDLRF